MMKMRRMLRVVLILMLVCFFWAGCSSLPKKTESRTMAFAGMKMRLAREAQVRRDFNRALVLYGDAYDYFTRIDDLEGKIEAALSMARQFFYLGKLDLHRQWLERASLWIDLHLPRMAGQRTLLLAEIYFADDNYIEVLKLVLPGAGSDWELMMELLCYKMIAKLKLKQDYKLEFNHLETGLPALQNSFVKDRLKDPEVLSFVYYCLGIVCTVRENPRAGLSFFEKAREVDQKIENTYGLGKDIFSIGRCYDVLKMPEQALSMYRRALDIFVLLEDREMSEKVQQALNAFKGDVADSH